MEQRVHHRIAVSAFLVLALAAFTGSASAAISVTGTATTSGLQVDRDNPVTITWLVNTTTTYLSTGATIANVVPALAVGGPLNDPQNTDSFVIPGAQVQAWLDQGVTAAVVERPFQEGRAGPVALGRVSLRLVPGQILGVTGTASTSTLQAGRDNPVTVTWRVSTTTTYLSTEARVANVVPPLSVAGALADPQTTDRFVIPAAQVQAWLDRGYRVAVVEREFRPGRTGPATRGTVRFSLVGSTLRDIREESTFKLQRLQLSFPNQTSLAVVEPGASLQAHLDVNYSGVGVLEGNWQVAEPGSTEGLPIYRTLRLEKRNLTQAQHTRLTGPPLPTGRPGRYLLRFCVIDRLATGGADDPDCPDSGPRVEASYQVLSRTAVEREPIELTPVGSDVTGKTEFRWTGVAAAVVYQLQVYRPARPDAAPEFVVGMLLPHQPTTTTLSTLVLDKLSPGQAYQWRVNALDSRGQVIGQSDLSLFAFAGP